MYDRGQKVESLKTKKISWNWETGPITYSLVISKMITKKSISRRKQPCHIMEIKPHRQMFLKTKNVPMSNMPTTMVNFW
jgi:hypothetical protein